MATLKYWDGAAYQTLPQSAVHVDSDHIGTCKVFAGGTVPTNWMIADGRLLTTVAYPELFAAIGTTYGSGGAGTFNIPDMRSRFVYGATTAGTQGAKAGASTVELADTEVPVRNHYHDMDSIGMGGAAKTTVDDGSGRRVIRGDDTSTGGGSGTNAIYRGSPGGFQYAIGVKAVIPSHLAFAVTPHENMPPHILMAWIIKVAGPMIDPSGGLVGPQGIPGTFAGPYALGALPAAAAPGTLAIIQYGANEWGLGWYDGVNTRWYMIGAPRPLITTATAAAGGAASAWRKFTGAATFTPPYSGTWLLRQYTEMQCSVADLQVGAGWGPASLAGTSSPSGTISQGSAHSYAANNRTFVASENGAPLLTSDPLDPRGYSSVSNNITLVNGRLIAVPLNMVGTA